MIDKFSFLKGVLLLATLDALSIWLLIVFYLTGIDIMFLVNVNFMVMVVLLSVFAVYYLRFNYFILLFLFFLVLSLIKGYIYVNSDLSFSTRLVFTYAFALVMPLLALNFTSAFSSKDYLVVVKEFKHFAVRYGVISFSGLAVYSILYFIGKISYFGMGTNLHYIFPFFIVGHKTRNTLLFFFFILISGKRAVLLNFLAQNIAIYSSLIIKRPITVMVLFLMTIGCVYLIFLNSNLFDRFDVFLNLDFNDPYSLLVAFSGRMEELVGIYNYFVDNPQHLFFGAPAGASYQWIIEISNYDEAKNYAHVTFFTYLFRYGLVFSVIIYGTFLVILIKKWSPSEPFFIAFVGIITSSMFGANLIVDPIAWIFIGFFIYVSKKSKLSLSV